MHIFSPKQNEANAMSEDTVSDCKNQSTGILSLGPFLHVIIEIELL